jgi:hypothetical protein
MMDLTTSRIIITAIKFVEQQSKEKLISKEEENKELKEPDYDEDLEEKQEEQKRDKRNHNGRNHYMNIYYGSCNSTFLVMLWDNFLFISMAFQDGKY